MNPSRELRYRNGCAFEGLKITKRGFLRRVKQAPSRSENTLSQQGKEMGLAFTLIRGWDYSPWGRLTWFELVLEPEESSLISLLTCSTEEEVGVAKLESCQHSNIRNGVILF